MTEQSIPSESHDADVSPEIITDLRRLVDDAGITTDRRLIERILATGLGLGLDGTGRLDLKIASTALEEMRSAFRLFARYRGLPKVTVFGSARTKEDDELYRITSNVSAALARNGWLVVTGAGPGIMRAAAEGAGPEHSIGISIRLPFEQPNAVLDHDVNLVTMKYFFTRKLMLVKESHGFVCVPGGFGTLDELFELLTLQQTGKSVPVPIVLLDRPGGTFWAGLKRFADEQLVPSGVISPGDLDRVLITDSEDAAAAEITGFWRNYDSLRWVGDRLVLRLKNTPSDEEIAGLNERFADLAGSHGIRRTEPLRAEVHDGDELELPRLVLHLDAHHVGRLHELIRAINELPSAPAR
ncbi:TIGR00730 family Rossman fold protein [Pseudoclavibacter chungangensis]|uniref:TIGR00730 family Rossman fold protein n=1 Tax=Pseudoclavibacter chungangensis TaxID=587635 RepID=A0A7J5BN97_9MICO|nr:TIGR00730 family Rossman fold protein [Pseudoclavibacter chungangensis]KAB1653593.1 TIGR00730 family Rossman fold protein [Pseudoclavibacter chungangensis]NYJ68695.1 hypothetical protein [Pseudoclavibacter chungangensis]